MHFLTNKKFLFFFNWEILLKYFLDSYSENSWKHVMSPSINYFFLFFSWQRLEGNLEKSTWKSWTSLDKKVDWTSNIWWLLETWMYLWGLRQDQNTYSGHWRLAWHVFKCSFSNVVHSACIQRGWVYTHIGLQGGWVSITSHRIVGIRKIRLNLIFLIRSDQKD